MLTPKEYTTIGEKAERIFTPFYESVEKDIAKRLKKYEKIKDPQLLHQFRILEETGRLKGDIVRSLAKELGISTNKVRKLLKKYIVKSLNRDNRILIKNGYNKKDLILTDNNFKLLNAMLKRVNNDIKNLTLTTLDTSQQFLTEELNKIYIEVVTGAKTPQQAVQGATERLEKHGTKVKYKGGRTYNLKKAMNMIVRTSVNQTAGVIQIERAKELGTDLMQITAHPTARPEHSKWQGKIVSLSGAKGFLTLSDIGYGTATGFKGVNCRHDWTPYFKGNQLVYSKKELKELET